MKSIAESLEKMAAHKAAAPVAVASTAALYYFGTGLNPLWPLAWLAPLPVLIVAFRGKWWVAALCAFLAFAVGRMNLFAYGMQITGGSMAGAVSVMVIAALIPAVAFMLAVLLARYATIKLPGWLAMLAFPFAISSYEFAASSNAFTGSLFSIAYSQTDFLPLMQVASLAGAWGITFLVSLLPSAIATPWRDRPTTILMPAAILIAVVLAYGGVRLATSNESQSLRVGLVASDASYKSSITQSRDDALGIVGVYAKPVRELAAQGAQVIALSEKIIGFTPDDKAEIVKALGELARSAQASLVVGASENATPRRNLALVFGPDGALLSEYEKRHLVPGIEGSYSQGTESAVLDLAGARVGVAICKDNDFPPWLRQYGVQGARMLIVPALDFDIDDRLHARVAVVRGIENGASLARAAGRGRITLSDAYGRIILERATAEAPVVTLVDDLPQGPGTTLYNRFGDWFGWLCVIAMFGLLVASRFFARRSLSS
jgi:apolipoprotein N-acyltransferase